MLDLLLSFKVKMPSKNTSTLTAVKSKRLTLDTHILYWHRPSSPSSFAEASASGKLRSDRCNCFSCFYDQTLTPTIQMLSLLNPHGRSSHQVLPLSLLDNSYTRQETLSPFRILPESFSVWSATLRQLANRDTMFSNIFDTTICKCKNTCKTNSTFVALVGDTQMQNFTSTY